MSFLNITDYILQLGALLLGAFITYFVQSCLRKKEVKENVNNFLSGIKDELTVLWDIYNKSVGEDLEKTSEGSPFEVYYIVSQKYFSVYENNTFLIPKIKSEQLRNSIISVYSHAKALLEGYVINNQLLTSKEAAELNVQIADNAVYRQLVGRLSELLARHCDQLKEGHNNLKKGFERLMKELDDGSKGSL